MLARAPKRFINAIPWVFVFAGIFLVWAGVMNQSHQTKLNREVGKTNQFYNRLVACLASESPTARTPEYTRYCYDIVELQTGVKAERYGTFIEQ